MPKRPVKTQASSTRAASGAFGGGFGSPSPAATFGKPSSPLTYVSEPPDLSSISDPNVVVAFKNLSKKDSTTKAKALEELQSYVSSSSGNIEDSVLEAWVRKHPACTIDIIVIKLCPPDHILSSHIHRQCSESSPACTCSSWSDSFGIRQAYRKAYATACGSVAGRTLRQRPFGV